MILLILAGFTDPIGPDPDSGVFDLGTKGTRLVLGGLGITFLAAGFWSLLKKK